jgi:hypothetical protein
VLFRRAGAVIADELARGAHRIRRNERRLGDRTREADVAFEFLDEQLEAVEVLQRVREWTPAPKSSGG